MAAAASTATGGTCIVETLTCEKDKARLEELAGLASAQLTSNAAEFEEPYPWGFDFCKFMPDAIHFVAVAESIICGWALVERERFVSYSTLEIGAITTRRKRMGDQRIGRMLHDAMVTYGRENGIDFIFLHAANETVKGTYSKWGYMPIFESEDDMKIPPTGDAAKYKEHAARMMFCPLHDDIVLSEKFKDMIRKDALQMAKEGWYGGPNTYRKDYKGEGGGTRRSRKRSRRNRRRNTRRRR
jgi:hypothetical protein